MKSQMTLGPYLLASFLIVGLPACGGGGGGGSVSVTSGRSSRARSNSLCTAGRRADCQRDCRRTPMELRRWKALRRAPTPSNQVIRQRCL